MGLFSQMSALDFEEAVHKLMKIELGGGQEVRRFLLLCLLPGLTNACRSRCAT